MLVKFTADGLNKKPIYIEADLVRIIASTENGHDAAVIYQQDSDIPYYVTDDIETVAKAIQKGRSKGNG